LQIPYPRTQQLSTLSVADATGVGLRGGYQARLATSGGPTGGATLSYAF